MRGTGDGSLRAFCYRMYLPHPTNTENSPPSWRHKGTRLITMKPLIYTAALAVGYTEKPTCTAYACKRQSAHTATHFACPAFARAGACCIAISAAFPRCKSAWPCLERFVSLTPKAPFPTRQLHVLRTPIRYVRILYGLLPHSPLSANVATSVLRNFAFVTRIEQPCKVQRL